MDCIEKLDFQSVDFIITCGWGYKVPKEIIELPKSSALNCHSSYLPDYKGGSVYQMQWANAEEYGGATIHFLTDKFDSGNIIAQESFKIKLTDSPLDILTKASELTAVLIREALLLLNADYIGIENKGGRYFLKTNKINLYLHRIVNFIYRLFKSDKRWLTKWK